MKSLNSQEFSEPQISGILANSATRSVDAMFDASTFREVVSGQRRGIWPGAVRAGLAAVEIPYRLAVGWRNRRYDHGSAEIHRAGVPVISIGNLTLGGTGKTPLVRWTARRLTQQGRRVAILSRGYGSTGDAPNDEALELARTLPDVPHLQDPDRVASAQTAVCERGCEVILLDDGFQHRRLARDLDVVLLDALTPLGFGHVFPRGLLREPLAGLSRADVVVLSRADLLMAEDREAIRRQVLPLAEDAVWCEVSHAPQALVNATGERQPIAHLARQRLAAFCGIGNPEGFRGTLAGQGLEVASWREFPDHHAFGPADVTALIDWSRKAAVVAVVCTLKDLVKLEVDQLGDLPLWAVEVEIDFLAGRDEMEEAVTRAASKGA